MPGPSDNSAVQKQVADELGKYVYALVDPRNGVPFYIGKGQGERFAAHGREAMLATDGDDDESEAGKKKKVDLIRAIRRDGEEPDIWIIRYGMKSNDAYTSVEAACIDLLHSFRLSDSQRLSPNLYRDQLTNRRKEQNNKHGIIRLKDLVAEMAAPDLNTNTPLLTIALGAWSDCKEELPGGRCRDGYGYKSEWLSSDERRKHYEEIGLSACAWWRFSLKRASQYEYAVAVHRGVTRALMRIIPGSMEERIMPDSGKKRRGFQFEIIDSGDLFNDVIGDYGHRIKMSQTQYYWPRPNET